MLDLVNKARVFATAAHAAAGNLRKFSREPYITHPAGVVDLLERITSASSTTLAVAWLHDVLEDTKVTVGDLKMEFPLDVVCAVAKLSDHEFKGNRAERKAAYRNKLARAGGIVADVKCADILHNIRDMKRLIPEFGAFVEVYTKEKHDQLTVLTESDPRLWREAKLAVENIEEVYWAYEESRRRAAREEGDG